MKTDSQRIQIYEYLVNGNRITSLQALKLFRCMRLGARINELKKMGIPIESQLVTVRDLDGKEKRVKEYWIEGTQK